MIRAVLHMMLHPRQFAECLAEKKLQQDPVYTEMDAQEVASERAIRKLHRKARLVRARDMTDAFMPNRRPHKPEAGGGKN